MMPFSVMFRTPLGILLRFLAVLLMLGQVFSVTVAYIQRRSPRVFAFSLAHLLFDLVFLTLLSDGAYSLPYLPYMREYSAPVLALYRLSWPWIAAVELVDAGLTAIQAASLVRYGQQHPSLQSIKQAVDLLHTGMCISEENGTVLLSNVTMSAWCVRLTGKPLSDANILWEAVQRQGQRQCDQWLVHAGDDLVLLFSESALRLEDTNYRQLTGENVSEQYRVTRELEEKNTRLRDMQYRIKAYRVREDELIMRQELLSARTTVHNQLGGALLIGKYHLEHPENTDADALQRMLRHINAYLLSEAEDPEPRSDEWESALHLAAGIGVQISLVGQVPESGTLRSLLSQAVRECAANTVKHAEGDRLEIYVEERGFSITGNGKLPTEEIVPSGGLRSLAMAVQQEGGSFLLQSFPGFELRVSL